jgi:hypothetical protein
MYQNKTASLGPCAPRWQTQLRALRHLGARILLLPAAMPADAGVHHDSGTGSQ